MFRSQVSKAYFNKINRNKNIKADSAGVIEGYLPLNEQQVSVARKLGIKLKGNPKGLSINLIKKQNLIIIVADDVPKSLFNCKEYIDFKTTKIIKWKVTDVFNDDIDFKEKIKEIIENIIKKVNILVKQLEKVK